MALFAQLSGATLAHVMLTGAACSNACGLSGCSSCSKLALHDRLSPVAHSYPSKRLPALRHWSSLGRTVHSCLHLLLAHLCETWNKTSSYSQSQPTVRKFEHRSVEHRSVSRSGASSFAF